MTKPDKSLIVTVLVPTLDPLRVANGPWDGAVGTGCAVDNGLVLTARHLVQRDNRNPERRYRGQKIPGKDTGKIPGTDHGFLSFLLNLSINRGLSPVSPDKPWSVPGFVS
jgi:hypothetical protein